MRVGRGGGGEKAHTLSFEDAEPTGGKFVPVQKIKYDFMAEFTSMG